MTHFKKTFTRRVPYPASVLFWNHWDHEHLLCVHPDYINAKILNETDRSTTLLTRTKIPYIPFLSNTQLNYIIRTGEYSLVDYKKTFFGIIGWAHIEISPCEDNSEHSNYKISYNFILNGAFKFLKYPLSFILNIWNRKFLEEDLPIIERRIKVLKSGFRDNVGIPKSVDERKKVNNLGLKEVKLQVNRTVRSPIDDLTSSMKGERKERVIKKMFLTRELEYPAHIVFWNHMDIEHTNYMHKGYVSEEVLYEDDRFLVFSTKFRLPIFSFIKLSSLEMVVRDGDYSFYNFSKTLFGIPFWAHVKIEPNGDESCHYKISYNVMLGRFTKFLWPIMKIMLEKWNEDVWAEEIPMLERRMKVLKNGFRDNLGMPRKLTNDIYKVIETAKFPFKRTYDVPYFNSHIKKKYKGK